jgi:hypothetical protein
MDIAAAELPNINGAHLARAKTVSIHTTLTQHHQLHHEQTQDI